MYTGTHQKKSKKIIKEIQLTNMESQKKTWKILFLKIEKNFILK